MTFVTEQNPLAAAVGLRGPARRWGDSAQRLVAGLAHQQDGDEADRRHGGQVVAHIMQAADFGELQSDQRGKGCAQDAR